MELSLRRGWTLIQPSFYVYESIVEEDSKDNYFSILMNCLISRIFVSIFVRICYTISSKMR